MTVHLPTLDATNPMYWWLCNMRLRPARFAGYFKGIGGGHVGICGVRQAGIVLPPRDPTYIWVWMNYRWLQTVRA